VEGMGELARFLDLVRAAVERPKEKRRTSDLQTSIGNAAQSPSAAEERNGDHLVQMLATIQESQERQDRVLMAFIGRFASEKNSEQDQHNDHRPQQSE